MRIQFIKKVSVWIIASTILVGCTTIGHKFDPAKVDQLVPGESSTADATQLIGKPSSESTAADGSKVLQWQYVQGTPFGGSSAHIAILFDKSGKMVRVTHRSVN